MTRISGDLHKGVDQRLKFQNQVVLKPENFDLSATRLREDGSEVERLLQEAYDKDDVAKDIMEAVRTGQRRHTKIPLAECEIQDNRL